MEALSLVKPQNTLGRSIKKLIIIDKICKKVVAEIPDFAKYKDDLESLLYVCLLAENLVVNKKGKEKVDKKEIVLACFDKLLGVGIANADLISKNIQFLFDNGKIKKVSFLKTLAKTLYNFIIKKAL